MSETQGAKAARTAKVDRVYDTARKCVVSTFTNGTVRELYAKDLPDSINVMALLTGIGYRVGQGASKVDTVEEAVTAYDETLAQLMSGEWRSRKEADPAKKLAVAYVQLAQERNMVLTLKAAREQIAAKGADFAAGKMAEAKYIEAYNRACNAQSDVDVTDL